MPPISKSSICGGLKVYPVLKLPGMDYNFIIKNRYVLNILANSPAEDLYAQPVEILYKSELKPEEPFFSIVMPIYNQEEIIEKNVAALLQFTAEKNYELIFLLDSCSDKSESVLLNLLKCEKMPDLLTNIIVLISHTPLFETASDNIGFLCSRGKYVIEIQSDIEITEMGYNMKMLKPFMKLSNVIGVSGRCCHNLTNSDGVGKLGNLIEFPINKSIDKGAFYVGETCNRGPLMLDLEKLRSLGFLDEKSYFLNNSDHDLFARAYYKNEWICGYIPIEFISPLQNGSTRKKKDELNESTFNRYKKEKSEQNGFLHQYICSNPKSRQIAKIAMN